VGDADRPEQRLHTRDAPERRGRSAARPKRNPGVARRRTARLHAAAPSSPPAGGASRPFKDDPVAQSCEEVPQLLCAVNGRPDGDERSPKRIVRTPGEVPRFPLDAGGEPPNIRWQEVRESPGTWRRGTAMGCGAVPPRTRSGALGWWHAEPLGVNEPPGWSCFFGELTQARHTGSTAPGGWHHTKRTLLHTVPRTRNGDRSQPRKRAPNPAPRMGNPSKPRVPHPMRTPANMAHADSRLTAVAPPRRDRRLQRLHLVPRGARPPPLPIQPRLRARRAPLTLVPTLKECGFSRTFVREASRMRGEGEER